MAELGEPAVAPPRDPPREPITLDGHDLVGTAAVPDGVRYRLVQRGDQFTILLDQTELMSTRASASERALATMTIARLDTPAPELLIGGYGMGYTLRAALRALGPDAQITLAELVPEIIEWARGPMQRLTNGCLDDPRVQLVDDDVALLIAAAREGYDAILLDVDNGPEGIVRLANDDLYTARGLQAALWALKPGGILAVWSVGTDAGFTARLVAAGFLVEEVIVREQIRNRGAHHVIWFAQKPAG
ncbi:MAG: spermidine synthase [Sphingomonadales bacterium]|nr:spermidine synthase [Sphingomonadales bacterium]